MNDQDPLFDMPAKPAPKRRKDPRRYPVPEDARLISCQFCGKGIYWGVNENNKTIPLSAESSDGETAINHWIDCEEREAARESFKQ